MFDRAFNFTSGAANPITNNKRTIKVDHQAAKKISQQVFSRKTNCNATDTTKSKNTTDTDPQCLQDRQDSSDND